MSIEENKALVRRYVEEVQGQHNLAAIDELVGADFVDHSSPGATGRACVCAFFTAMFAAFPDMHFTIRMQIAEGDKVLTYKTFHGTHLGPFNGIPPTGRTVEVECMDILTVVDRKITEHWAVADDLGMMQQLGVA